jgi:D-glycero-alpha-D-manno-heptose-7-phosphate kinase
VIEATAPVRICDLGGWTDTWFGGPGQVLNIAAGPGIAVAVEAADGPLAVDLRTEIGGQAVPIVPDQHTGGTGHPLLAAVVGALPPPATQPVRITVRTQVPPGSGAGTSASVSVALLGALSRLRGEDRSPEEIAYLAHRIETEDLGLESGIQDHLCAASGGINFLAVEEYPLTTVRALPRWDELGRRLSLVYLGSAHDSSAMHRLVMAGAASVLLPAFDELRRAAQTGRDAVARQDVVAFGQAMIANNEAQSSLHPDVVGTEAAHLIATAAACGAIGWKVNGAGGSGGSMTLLSATPEAKAHLEDAVLALDSRYRVLPVTISDTGLSVTGRL